MNIFVTFARYSKIFVAFFSLSGTYSHALETPWLIQPEVQFRIITKTNTMDVDGRYIAAMEIIPANGWKTFWRSPGQSGAGIETDFSSSQNAAIGALLYPEPEVFEAQGFTTIGYKSTVLIPFPVTALDPLRPSRLRGTIYFQVCRTICLPLDAPVELTLTPGHGRPSKHFARITHTMRRVPQRTVAPSQSIIWRDGQMIWLQLKGMSVHADAMAILESPYGLAAPSSSVRISEGTFGTRFGFNFGARATHLTGKTMMVSLFTEPARIEFPLVLLPGAAAE